MSRPTLTRTDQVLKELRKGAFIESVPGQGALLRLVNRKGVILPAWQQALRAAQAQHAQGEVRS